MMLLNSWKPRVTMKHKPWFQNYKPHAALENTFKIIVPIQDQLFRSVTHGVSTFTRIYTQFIACASTVCPSTVTGVSLRSMHITSKKDLPESCKSSLFSLWKSAHQLKPEYTVLTNSVAGEPATPIRLQCEGHQKLPEKRLFIARRPDCCCTGWWSKLDHQLFAILKHIIGSTKLLVHSALVQSKSNRLPHSIWHPNV